jgi:hypothetical protein
MPNFFSPNNKGWCAPSKLYFILSMMALIIMGIQNIGNQDIYCIGSYTCSVYSTLLIFAIKFLYVLFWTWVLNLICDSGLPIVSWILFLFPFIVFFILIAAGVLYN